MKNGKSYWEIVLWILFEVSWNASMFSFFGYWIFIKIMGCHYDKSLCQPLSFFSWNSHLINIILVNIDFVLNRYLFFKKSIYHLFYIVLISK